MEPLKHTPAGGELPPLPAYMAEPVDPAKIAAPNTGELADFYVAIGGDGFGLSLAGLKNGRTRHEIGAEWAAIRQGVHPNDHAEAARRHFDTHLDLSSTGAVVTAGAKGGHTLTYARDVLYNQLRRPARPYDTDVRLHTPYEFYVPGTRFDDAFPADNLQVILALLADGHIDSSLKTLAGSEYNTMRFGYDPNFSKVAMLRQQTPLDSFAVEAHRGIYGNRVLTHFAPALRRNLAFMNEGKERLSRIPLNGHGEHRRIVRLPGGLHAYRYWDDTPVDYETRSVIRIESAAKERATLDKIVHRGHDRDEKAYLWVKGNKNLAAGAESFQDMTDSFLEDGLNLETIRTTDICTSWLQAAVAHKTKLAAEACEIAGDYTAAEHYWKQFNELKLVVNTLMWRQISDTQGHFTDILTDGRQTGALNAAQLLPLLVGNDFVSYGHARMSITMMREKLLGPFGLGTTDAEGCREQWSGKIRNWPALAALAKHAAMEQAREAKRRNIPGESPEPFIQFAEEVDAAMRRGIKGWHEEQGTLPERIHGEDPTKVALGGEYCDEEDGKEPEPQIGFGMTAGAFIVAETMDVRKVFEHVEGRGGSWLAQSFAVHLGRSALTLVA